MRNYDKASNSGKLVILKPIDWEYEILPNGQRGEKRSLKYPYFQELEKVADPSGKLSWQIVTDPKKPLTSVTGNLSGVKVLSEKKEIKGRLQVFHSVKVILKDPDVNETYSIDLNWRVSTRNLFNVLTGLENFDNVEINYYRSKGKDDRDGYETFFVKQNGEPVRGPMTFEQMQGMTKKVRFNGVESTDTEQLQNHLSEKLRELDARINRQPAPAARPATVSAVDDFDDESCPF